MIQWLELGVLTAKGPGFDPSRAGNYNPTSSTEKKKKEKERKEISLGTDKSHIEPNV